MACLCLYTIELCQVKWHMDGTTGRCNTKLGQKWEAKDYRLQNIAKQKIPCTSSVQMQDGRRMTLQYEKISQETLLNATH